MFGEDGDDVSLWDAESEVLLLDQLLTKPSTTTNIRSKSNCGGQKNPPLSNAVLLLSISLRSQMPTATQRLQGISHERFAISIRAMTTKSTTPPPFLFFQIYSTISTAMQTYEEVMQQYIVSEGYSLVGRLGASSLLGSSSNAAWNDNASTSKEEHETTTTVLSSLLARLGVAVMKSCWSILEANQCSLRDNNGMGEERVTSVKSSLQVIQLILLQEMNESVKEEDDDHDIISLEESKRDGEAEPVFFSSSTAATVMKQHEANIQKIWPSFQLWYHQSSNQKKSKNKDDYHDATYSTASTLIAQQEKRMDSAQRRRDVLSQLRSYILCCEILLNMMLLNWDWKPLFLSGQFFQIEDMFFSASTSPDKISSSPSVTTPNISRMFSSFLYQPPRAENIDYSVLLKDGKEKFFMPIKNEEEDILGNEKKKKEINSEVEDPPLSDVVVLGIHRNQDKFLHCPAGYHVLMQRLSQSGGSEGAAVSSSAISLPCICILSHAQLLHVLLHGMFHDYDLTSELFQRGNVRRAARLDSSSQQGQLMVFYDPPANNEDFITLIQHCSRYNRVVMVCEVTLGQTSRANPFESERDCSIHSGAKSIDDDERVIGFPYGADALSWTLNGNIGGASHNEESSSSIRGKNDDDDDDGKEKSILGDLLNGHTCYLPRRVSSHTNVKIQYLSFAMAKEEKKEEGGGKDNVNNNMDNSGYVLAPSDFKSSWMTSSSSSSLLLSREQQSEFRIRFGGEKEEENESDDDSGSEDNNVSSSTLDTNMDKKKSSPKKVGNFWSEVLKQEQQNGMMFCQGVGSGVQFSEVLSAILGSASGGVKTLSAAKNVEKGRGGDRFTIGIPSADITKTVVKASVTDIVSEVFLIQEICNNSGTHIKDAKYEIALPRGSSVFLFEAFFQTRVIKGIVKPKAQAQKEYKEAVERGQRAYLVEQEKEEEEYTLFSIALGNFAARSSVVIKLAYVNELMLQRWPSLDLLSSTAAMLSPSSSISSTSSTTNFFQTLIFSFPFRQLPLTKCEVQLRMPYEIISLASSHHCELKRCSREASLRFNEISEQHLFVAVQLGVASYTPRLWVESGGSGGGSNLASASLAHSKAVLLVLSPQLSIPTPSSKLLVNKNAIDAKLQTGGHQSSFVVQQEDITVLHFILDASMASTPLWDAALAWLQLLPQEEKSRSKNRKKKTTIRSNTSMQFYFNFIFNSCSLITLFGQPQPVNAENIQRAANMISVWKKKLMSNNVPSSQSGGGLPNAATQFITASARCFQQELLALKRQDQDQDQDRHRHKKNEGNDDGDEDDHPTEKKKVKEEEEEDADFLLLSSLNFTTGCTLHHSLIHCSATASMLSVGADDQAELLLGQLLSFHGAAKRDEEHQVQYNKKRDDEKNSGKGGGREGKMNVTSLMTFSSLLISEEKGVTSVASAESIHPSSTSSFSIGSHALRWLALQTGGFFHVIKCSSGVSSAPLFAQLFKRKNNSSLNTATLFHHLTFYLCRKVLFLSRVHVNWSLEQNAYARQQINSSILQAPRFVPVVANEEVQPIFGVSLNDAAATSVTVAKYEAMQSTGGQGLEGIVGATASCATAGLAFHRLALNRMLRDHEFGIWSKCYELDTVKKELFVEKLTNLCVKLQVISRYTSMVAIDPVTTDPKASTPEEERAAIESMLAFTHMLQSCESSSSSSSLWNGERGASHQKLNLFAMVESTAAVLTEGMGNWDTVEGLLMQRRVVSALKHKIEQAEQQDDDFFPFEKWGQAGDDRSPSASSLTQGRSHQHQHHQRRKEQKVEEGREVEEEYKLRQKMLSPTASIRKKIEKEKEIAVNNIESDLNEVQQCYQDFSTLINDQQECIAGIDGDIEVLLGDVPRAKPLPQDGTKSKKKEERLRPRSQQKSRKTTTADIIPHRPAAVVDDLDECFESGLFQDDDDNDDNTSVVLADQKTCAMDKEEDSLLARLNRLKNDDGESFSGNQAGRFNRRPKAGLFETGGGKVAASNAKKVAPPMQAPPPTMESTGGQIWNGLGTVASPIKTANDYTPIPSLQPTTTASVSAAPPPGAPSSGTHFWNTVGNAASQLIPVGRSMSKKRRSVSPPEQQNAAPARLGRHSYKATIGVDENIRSAANRNLRAVNTNILNRGERMEELLCASQDLSCASQVFYRQSKKSAFFSGGDLTVLQVILFFGMCIAIGVALVVGLVWLLSWFVHFQTPTSLLQLLTKYGRLVFEGFIYFLRTAGIAFWLVNGGRYAYWLHNHPSSRWKFGKVVKLHAVEFFAVPFFLTLLGSTFYEYYFYAESHQSETESGFCSSWKQALANSTVGGNNNTSSIFNATLFSPLSSQQEEFSSSQATQTSSSTIWFYLQAMLSIFPTLWKTMTAMMLKLSCSLQNIFFSMYWLLQKIACFVCCNSLVMTMVSSVYWIFAAMSGMFTILSNDSGFYFRLFTLHLCPFFLGFQCSYLYHVRIDSVSSLQTLFVIKNSIWHSLYLEFFRWWFVKIIGTAIYFGFPILSHSGTMMMMCDQSYSSGENITRVDNTSSTCAWNYSHLSEQFKKNTSSSVLCNQTETSHAPMMMMLPYQLSALELQEKLTCIERFFFTYFGFVCCQDVHDASSNRGVWPIAEKIISSLFFSYDEDVRRNVSIPLETTFTSSYAILRYLGSFAGQFMLLWGAFGVITIFLAGSWPVLLVTWRVVMPRRTKALLLIVLIFLVNPFLKVRNRSTGIVEHLPPLSAFFPWDIKIFIILHLALLMLLCLNMGFMHRLRRWIGLPTIVRSMSNLESFFFSENYVGFLLIYFALGWQWAVILSTCSSVFVASGCAESTRFVEIAGRSYVLGDSILHAAKILLFGAGTRGDIHYSTLLDDDNCVNASGQLNSGSHFTFMDEDPAKAYKRQHALLARNREKLTREMKSFQRQDITQIFLQHFCCVEIFESLHVRFQQFTQRLLTQMKGGLARKYCMDSSRSTTAPRRNSPLSPIIAEKASSLHSVSSWSSSFSGPSSSGQQQATTAPSSIYNSITELEAFIHKQLFLFKLDFLLQTLVKLEASPLFQLHQGGQGEGGSEKRKLKDPLEAKLWNSGSVIIREVLLARGGLSSFAPETQLSVISYVIGSMMDIALKFACMKVNTLVNSSLSETKCKMGVIQLADIFSEDYLLKCLWKTEYAFLPALNHHSESQNIHRNRGSKLQQGVMGGAGGKKLFLEDILETVYAQRTACDNGSVNASALECHQQLQQTVTTQNEGNEHGVTSTNQQTTMMATNANHLRLLKVSAKNQFQSHQNKLHWFFAQVFDLQEEEKNRKMMLTSAFDAKKEASASYLHLSQKCPSSNFFSQLENTLEEIIYHYIGTADELGCVFSEYNFATDKEEQEENDEEEGGGIEEDDDDDDDEVRVTNTIQKIHLLSHHLMTVHHSHSQITGATDIASTYLLLSPNASQFMLKEVILPFSGNEKLKRYAEWLAGYL